MAMRDPHVAATQIVRDAGGQLIGRTRLQKVAYLAQQAGFPNGFRFEYRHYGPFSQDLADGMEIASAFDDVKEEEAQAAWGGWYSVYRTPGQATPPNEPRAAFIRRAAEIDAVELELAATALFLSREGVSHPWAETAARKPQKAAEGRLARAKRAYARLREETRPNSLPELPDE